MYTYDLGVCLYDVFSMRVVDSSKKRLFLSCGVDDHLL